MSCAFDDESKCERVRERDIFATVTKTVTVAKTNGQPEWAGRL